MLVYAYTAISKFSLPGESHHCREDATSKFPVHVCIEIFTANQWTGMETEIVKAESRQCSESDGRAVAQGEELSPRLGDPGLSTFVARNYTKFGFR